MHLTMGCLSVPLKPFYGDTISDSAEPKTIAALEHVRTSARVSCWPVSGGHIDSSEAPAGAPPGD